MKFTQLKQDLEEGTSFVYLLEGADGYFRDKGEAAIKDKYLTSPELDFASFDGENLKGAAIGDLVVAVKNYPFMSLKRVVKASEFYPNEQEFERYLKPLISDFPDSAILLIVNSQSKKGCDLKRKKGVTYVDCGKADRESVAKWAYITLKRAGVPCSARASGNIADYCLCDMARVSVEVQKLIAYKGEGALSDEEVDDLVYKDADYRLYEMTNAVARRDFTTYCTIKEDFLSKGSDELAVLNGLFNYFKTLLSSLLSPLSDARYAEETGAKEYAVKMNRERARAIGEGNLIKWSNLLYGKISDFKGGLITPASALMICENTIFFDGK